MQLVSLEKKKILLVVINYCCEMIRVSFSKCANSLTLVISFAGGSSNACPENAGGAGTLYDAVPRSLIISNHNKSTDTETLLLEFPYQPLWTNIYVRNKARATVPLLWSRVQVCKAPNLYFGRCFFLPFTFSSF